MLLEIFCADKSVRLIALNMLKVKIPFILFLLNLFIELLIEFFLNFKIEKTLPMKYIKYL